MAPLGKAMVESVAVWKGKPGVFRAAGADGQLEGNAGGRGPFPLRVPDAIVKSPRRLGLATARRMTQKHAPA